MTNNAIHKVLTYSIVIVWIVNGLFCKVLHLVPRHQQIVATILETKYPKLLTIIIGCLEILMAVWILSNIKTRLNAITQIIVVAIMNTLEFILVPHLLLWGKFNAVFAGLFILLVFYNEFYLNKRLGQQT